MEQGTTASCCTARGGARIRKACGTGFHQLGFATTRDELRACRRQKCRPSHHECCGGRLGFKTSRYRPHYPGVQRHFRLTLCYFKARLYHTGGLFDGYYFGYSAVCWFFLGACLGPLYQKILRLFPVFGSIIFYLQFSTIFAIMNCVRTILILFFRW